MHERNRENLSYIIMMFVLASLVAIGICMIPIMHHDNQVIHKHVHEQFSDDRHIAQQEYDQAYEDDVEQLKKYDNRRAQLTNLEYDQKFHTNKKVYPKSRDGNYWSWFGSHKSTDLDDGDNLYSGDDDDIEDNQQVLENHGVDTGPNFDNQDDD